MTASAAVITTLMTGHWYLLGDVLFALGATAPIWGRRFGPGYSALGALVTIALVSSLITSAPPDVDRSIQWSLPLFAAAVGALAYAALTLARARGRNAARRTTSVPARKSAAKQRPSPSTRMAIQMLTALAESMIAGRMLFEVHWTWVVLTTFVVASGTRSRGDVAYKAVLRVAGALIGSTLAMPLGLSLRPHSAGPLVAVFVVLVVATFLRPIRYAIWAAGITSTLALLYSYDGLNAPELLATRCAAILLGGLIGVGAAWFVLPIRTYPVIYRRLTVVAAAIRQILADLGSGTHPNSPDPRLSVALVELRQVTAPATAHHRLRQLRPRRRNQHHPAATIESIEH